MALLHRKGDGEPRPQGRVLQHANDEKKGHWYRALLIQRDTCHGLDSAQTSWLESRIFKKLKSSVEAQPQYGQEPGGESLPTDEHWLENLVPAVLRVLQVLGHNPAAADDDGGSATNASPTRKVFTEKITDLVAAKLLRDGEELSSTNSRWQATAHIVDGK